MNLNIWKSILATILFYLLWQLSSFLLLLTSFFKEDIDVFLWSNSIGFLIYHLLFFLIVFWSLKKIQSKNNKFELPRNFILLGFCTLIGFVFSYIQNVLNYGYGYLFDSSFLLEEDTEKLEFEFFKAPILFTRIIVIPITEELFFRGFILKELTHEYQWIIALIISSFLFSFVHLPDVHRVYITLFGGFFAGLIYLKTNKLSYPIAFHIAWNFIIGINNYIEVPFL